MQTNLIFVEEILKNGESPTTSMIADELRKKGRKVICINVEGKNNSKDDMDGRSSEFQTYQMGILKKWRAIISEQEKDTIYVFNIGYFWNSVSETMRWFNMAAEEMKVFLTEVATIIRPLKPIYIHISDENARTEKSVKSDYENSIEFQKAREAWTFQILQELDFDYYTVSQDMCAEELAQLCLSVGWGIPSMEQMQTAIENSTKSFIVRHKGKAIATINWLGDYGMHWFIKEFVVHKDYQGKMIGTFLYRYAENDIKRTMKPGWKTCIDLRSSQGKEPFYQKLGFQIMTEQETGSGMEKMIENRP